MMPFDNLTRRGQARRLRKLALAALERYPLEVAELRLLGNYTNTLFRLQTTTGQRYVIRVCTPGWRTETDLRSEVMWLQALQQETDISAPHPLATRDGAFITQAQAPGVPETRRCLVMSWLPGTPLENHLTEKNLYKMGMLFAHLHDYGIAFTPPAGFTQRRMNSICARGEADVLFSEASRDAFTPRGREIIDQVRVRVEAAFAALYTNPAGLRVIHNDLWHGNIKIYRGRLYPLDFEDTVWGYPVQDIAMALQDLMTDVPPAAFEPLQAAFRAGYEAHNPWPEDNTGQIDIFRAGRMLWVANYVARFRQQYLADHLTWLAREFERYLETGQIRKEANHT